MVNPRGLVTAGQSGSTEETSLASETLYSYCYVTSHGLSSSCATSQITPETIKQREEHLSCVIRQENEHLELAHTLNGIMGNEAQSTFSSG